MKSWKTNQTFLFSILFISCIISMVGIGLEEHALSSAEGKNSNSILSQSFSTCDNITTIHVSEGNLTLAIIKGIRNNLSQKSFVGKIILLFFILAFLSGVFRLTQEIYSFYDRLYVWHRYYLIAYIHAKDGRKRAMPC